MVCAAMMDRNNIVPHYVYGGREQMGAEKQLLICLWYIADNECYRSIADRFGVAESSALTAVRDVIAWLASLASIFIRWPRGDRVTECEQGFFERKMMPHVIGAIDGCHIRIAAPHEHPEDYINRKLFHSLVLQAIVDSRKLFTDVYIGQPGSMHDSRILKVTSVRFGSAACRWFVS